MAVWAITLAAPIYADQPLLKNGHVVYTVTYWDRVMRPDQKKVWRFIADTSEALENKVSDIVLQLDQRTREVNNLTQSTFDQAYDPASFVMRNILRLKSRKKYISLGLDNIGRWAIAYTRLKFLKGDDERKYVSERIRSSLSFIQNLQPDGRVKPWAGRILDWGEHGSYADFRSNIETIPEIEKAEVCNTLIKLNLNNLLFNKVVWEKEFVFPGQLDKSEFDDEKQPVVPSGPVGKKIKKKINNDKIKKIVYREPAIEVN